MIFMTLAENNNNMMILLFSVGDDKYGINVRNVTEVLPSVALKHFPNGPAYVAGLLNYRGQVVPVIDLTLLMAAQVSRNRISSRIVIVDYPCEGETHYLLGLLIEKITETMKIPGHAFSRSGVTTHGAPFLGDIAIHNEIMVQMVDIKRVLPESVKELLFYDGIDKSSVDNGAEE